MTRLLFNCMLLLYVLLLGGYKHAFHHDVHFSQHRVHTAITHIHYYDGENDEAQITSDTSPFARPASEKVKAIEIQEDESWPTKKHLEPRNPCISAIFPLPDGNRQHYRKSSLPCCAHFSYTASDKFIVHRVIRI